jgi:tetratricopeptide (TPR) repeat protein
MTDLLQFFKRATQAYQAGDMDLALSFIQKIFKKDPSYPQILHLWGTILARMKAFEAAEGKFKQALSRNLNDWEAWNNLGVVYKAQDNFKEALNALIKAERGLPDRADIPYNIANIYKSEGKYTEALEKYQQALKINPSFSMAWNNIGLVYEEMGQHEQAEKAYLQGLEHDPRNPNILYNLGLTEKRKGNWDKAKKAFAQSLKTRPGWHASRNNLGVALQKTGRKEEAKAIFQSLTQETPDSAETWNNYGLVLQEMGESGEAGEAFTRALEIAPDFTHAVLNLDSVHQGEGKPEVSLPMLQSYLEKDPENPEIMVRLGETLFALKKYDGAVSYLLQSLQIQGENARALSTLVKSYLGQDRLDLAKKTRERLLKVDPQGGDIPYAFAVFYHKKGLMTNALGEVKQFLQNQPENKPGLVLQAQLEYEAGNYQSCLDILEPFLEEKSPGVMVLQIALEANRGLGNEEAARDLVERLLKERTPLGEGENLPNLSDILTTYEDSVSALETALNDPWARSMHSLRGTQPHRESLQEEAFDPSILDERPIEIGQQTLLDLGDLNPALVMDEVEEVLWVKEEDEVVPSRPEDDSPVLKDRLLEQALANAAATQAANQSHQPQWPAPQPPSAYGGPQDHGMTREMRPPAPPVQPQPQQPPPPAPSPSPAPSSPAPAPTAPPPIPATAAPSPAAQGLPPGSKPQDQPPLGPIPPMAMAPSPIEDIEEDLDELEGVGSETDQGIEEEILDFTEEGEDIPEERDPNNFEGWAEEDLTEPEDEEEQEDLGEDLPPGGEDSEEEGIFFEESEENLDFDQTLAEEDPSSQEFPEELAATEEQEELVDEELPKIEDQLPENWENNFEPQGMGPSPEPTEEELGLQDLNIGDPPVEDSLTTKERILDLMEFLGELTNFLPEDKKAQVLKDGIPLKIEEIRLNLNKEGVEKPVDTQKAIEPKPLPVNTMGSSMGVLKELDQDDPIRALGKKVGSRLKEIMKKVEEKKHGRGNSPAGS